MASKGPSRGGETSSLGATKQLLDELDALMEKMLALPVSEGEESSAAPTLTLPRHEAAGGMPKVSATLTVLDADAHAATPEEGAPSPRRDDPAPLAPPHADFAFDSAKGYADAGSAQIPAEAIPPSLLHVQVPDVQVLPVSGRSLGTLAAQPLIWTNAIFDLGTRFLGPLGRWLRTGPGRQVLGLVGIALFLAAIIWVIRDWMSWIH